MAGYAGHGQEDEREGIVRLGMGIWHLILLEIWDMEEVRLVEGQLLLFPGPAGIPGPRLKLLLAMYDLTLLYGIRYCQML